MNIEMHPLVSTIEGASAINGAFEGDFSSGGTYSSLVAQAARDESPGLPVSLGLDLTLAFLTVLYIAHLLTQLRLGRSEPIFARVDGSFLQARKRCLVDQKVTSRC